MCHVLPKTDKGDEMVVVGLILLGVVVRFIYSLIGGIFLMLAIGIIHHEWIHPCPTIGYWWAVLLSFLIGMGVTFEASLNSKD
jgi:hypothetical protein